MTHGTSGRGGSWPHRCEAALVSIYRGMIGSLKAISHHFTFTRKAPLLVAGLMVSDSLSNSIWFTRSLPPFLLAAYSPHGKKAPPLAGDGSRAGLLPGKVVESERQDARDYMVNEKLWWPKESPAVRRGSRSGRPTKVYLADGRVRPLISLPPTFKVVCSLRWKTQCLKKNRRRRSSPSKGTAMPR
jgi:hypothetical protein